MKMCQAFAKNGHEAILLVPNKPAIEPHVADIYEFYGVEPCFEVRCVPKMRLKRQPHIYSLMAVTEARRLQPDVVYGRVLAACYFSSLLGLPTIYEAHTPLHSAKRSHRWLFSQLIRAKGFRRLVVISEALQQYYWQNYQLPNEMILVAHDGADIPRPAEVLPFTQPDKLQVGYVGHLYPGKGMEIVADLAARCDWADFHVVGGLEADLRHWQDKTSGLKNLKFYGFKPHSETDRYRQACDVLLAPYQRHVAGHGGGKGDLSRWMSPLKIFEYMAAGKAILCSDLPVLWEVLTHEKTALLCDPDDMQSWEMALKRLRDGHDLRCELGEMARQTLLTTYSWQVRAANVVNGLAPRGN
jgi:glycosyltransferase involved in cell wall biosynthesis